MNVNSLPPKLPPGLGIEINLIQLIQYCRQQLGASDIAIMQTWYSAFAASYIKPETPPVQPEPPGPRAS